jgi:hypothetical protein
LGSTLLALVSAGASISQTTDVEIRRLVRSDSWSAEEIANFDKGGPVVRSLDTTDKQELVTVGVLRIERLASVTMEMFRRSMDQKSEGSLKTRGRFSQTPSLSDLGNLEIDDETIRQLEKCKLRKCDLNLPASVIRELQQVDWTSPDAKQQATKVLREMMLSVANGYSTRGVASLGTYDNRLRAVDLAESHRSLLARSIELHQLAPEFYRYLDLYPVSELDGVQNSLHWSVLDFGLKPSITISHTAAYAPQDAAAEQFFVASRQIYSSRYLDSSFSIAMLLRVVDKEHTSAYLLFVDRSRSDALDGPLGGFAREVVRKDASERVRKMLDGAHLRLLAFSRPQPMTGDSEEEKTSYLWMIIGGVIVAALSLMLLLRRRRYRIS